MKMRRTQMTTRDQLQYWIKNQAEWMDTCGGDLPTYLNKYCTEEDPYRRPPPGSLRLLLWNVGPLIKVACAFLYFVDLFRYQDAAYTSLHLHDLHNALSIESTAQKI
jgi:hypothetical protein